MMLRTGTAIVVAVMLFGSLSAMASEPPMTFLASHYYLLSLGQIAAEIDTIRHNAQSSGFSRVI